MWKVGTLALLIALATAWACGPSGTAGQQCTDPTGAPVNGTIQKATDGSGCGSLAGTVAAGQPCHYALQCAPTCCSCGTLATSPQSVEVAYCNGGLCATPDVTCCTFLVSEMSATDGGSKSCM